jgi:hypothetical protein
VAEGSQPFPPASLIFRRMANFIAAEQLEEAQLEEAQLEGAQLERAKLEEVLPA